MSLFNQNLIENELILIKNTVDVLNPNVRISDKTGLVRLPNRSDFGVRRKPNVFFSFGSLS